MLKKKFFGVMLLAAATVSSTAMAQDRTGNTIVGALTGAAIGGAVNGRNGAIVGSVLGAAVGNSAATRDDYYYRNNNYAYSSGYYQPAPQPVYVEPAPVYVAPPPAYYYDRGPDVVVVGGGPRYYDRGYRERVYYDRGYDHGHYGHDRGGWHR